MSDNAFSWKASTVLSKWCTGCVTHALEVEKHECQGYLDGEKKPRQAQFELENRAALFPSGLVYGDFLLARQCPTGLHVKKGTELQSPTTANPVSQRLFELPEKFRAACDKGRVHDPEAVAAVSTKPNIMLDLTGDKEVLNQVPSVPPPVYVRHEPRARRRHRHPMMRYPTPMRFKNKSDDIVLPIGRVPWKAKQIRIVTSVHFLGKPLVKRGSARRVLHVRQIERILDISDPKNGDTPFLLRKDSQVDEYNKASERIRDDVNSDSDSDSMDIETQQVDALLAPFIEAFTREMENASDDEESESEDDYIDPMEVDALMTEGYFMPISENYKREMEERIEAVTNVEALENQAHSIRYRARLAARMRAKMTASRAITNRGNSRRTAARLADAINAESAVLHAFAKLSAKKAAKKRDLASPSNLM